MALYSFYLTLNAEKDGVAKKILFIITPTKILHKQSNDVNQK